MHVYPDDSKQFLANGSLESNDVWFNSECCESTMTYPSVRNYTQHLNSIIAEAQASGTYFRLPHKFWVLWFLICANISVLSSATMVVKMFKVLELVVNNGDWYRPQEICLRLIITKERECHEGYCNWLTVGKNKRKTVLMIIKLANVQYL